MWIYAGKLGVVQTDVRVSEHVRDLFELGDRATAYIEDEEWSGRHEWGH